MAVDQRDLRYIDSDGHILEPPTAMLEFAPGRVPGPHLAPRDRRRRHRVARLQRQADAVGGLAGTAGFSGREGRAGPPRRDHATSTPGPSGWTATLRLKDMDTDGIECRCSTRRPCSGCRACTTSSSAGLRRAPTTSGAPAHLDEGQGRLFGAGALPPMHDADDVQGVADEIRHVAELAGDGVGVPAAQPRRRVALLQRPGLRPHLVGAQDTGLPMAFHPFLAPDLPGCLRGPEAGPAARRRWQLRAAGGVRGREGGSRRRHPAEHLLHPGDRQPRRRDERDLLHTSGGVAERFPGAKFIFLEANGGWLVPWLERLDHHAKKFPWDVPWLKMLPSEYFRRQCWISFDPDETMLAFTANSPLCGADRIIWASDYPHPDAKFPGVTQELTEALDGLSYEQRRDHHQRERARPLRHRLTARSRGASSVRGGRRLCCDGRFRTDRSSRPRKDLPWEPMPTSSGGSPTRPSSEGTRSVIDELVADDYVEHDAPPGVPASRDGFRQMAEMVTAAFTDRKMEFDDYLETSDGRVVENWAMTGTHTAGGVRCAAVEPVGPCPGDRDLALLGGQGGRALGRGRHERRVREGRRRLAIPALECEAPTA